MHLLDIFYMIMNIDIETTYNEANQIIKSYFLNTKNIDGINSIPIKAMITGLYSKYYSKEFSNDIIKLFENINYFFKDCSAFYGLGLFMYIIEIYKDGMEDTAYIDIHNYISKYIVKSIKRYNYNGGVKELELISGLSGIGLCILNLCENDIYYKESIRKIIDMIIKKYLYSNYDKWILNKSEMTSYEITNFPQGCINLGCAHGLSGILVFLAKAYNKGFNDIRIKFTIEKIVQYILDQIIYIPPRYYFPSRVTNKKEINNQYPLSWCHGISGICNAILLSGISLENSKYISISNSIFKTYLKHSDINKEFLSATVCHGYSGVIPILRNFYNQTKDTFYINQLTTFIKKVYEFYCHDKCFYDYQYSIESKMIKRNLNRNSLLTGNESVILTLISFVNEDDYYFNLLGII